MSAELTPGDQARMIFSDAATLEPEPGAVVALDFDEGAYDAEETPEPEVAEESGPVAEEPAASQPVVDYADHTLARHPVPPAPEDHGTEKFYSSKEVATFFGKSTQWLYWGMKTKDADGNPVDPIFLYPDGTPIEPMKIGKGERRRYTLPIIREMAYSCYRRGNLKEDELKIVLARIKQAEKDKLVASR
jgi:hypothetical protein